MDNENENVGKEESVETTATETPEIEEQGNESTPNEPITEEVPATFTQDQLNDIVRERLRKASESIYKKYNVIDEKGLDEMADKAKAYDELKTSYDELARKAKNYEEQAVLSNNNIIPDKQDDVRTYFKGKGLEISDKALKPLLQTHPEWLPQTAKSTTVVPMGGDRMESHEETDEEKALKLFGFDKFVK